MTAPAGPLPEGFRLDIDPDVRRPRRDVLIGGSPLRVLRLGEPAVRLLDRWEAGCEVGPSGPAGRFARRLVDAGIAHPVPPQTPSPGTSIVIPVRDRPEGLRLTLEALGGRGVDEVIIVDDGSSEPVSIEEIQREHLQLEKVSVIRLETAAGPAAARNAGWRSARSEIVAFVDADCTPVAGWITTLVGHFADHSVAAVGPRIASDPSLATRLGRYEMVRSPLDLGVRPAPVRPRSRVPYVPTACLAVRRRALVETGGFNQALRFGEDVDLVWRLHRNGWTVRYEPAALVIHPPRPSVGAWVRQRFDYGRSAAQLAEIHGSDVAPLDVSPWSAGSWGLVVGGHPAVAAAIAAGSAATLARRAGRDLDTAAELFRLAVRGNVRAGARIAEALRRAWLPLALVALAMTRPSRARRRMAGAILAAFSLPIAEWVARRPPVDPVAWMSLRIADDVSYQAGLWCGAIEGRSAKPLLPRF